MSEKVVIRFLLRLILGLSALAAACTLAGALWAADLSGPVEIEWVPDGDTLHSASGLVYRLQGIDTPETGHENGKEQYFSARATEFLRQLVKPDRVFVDRGHLSRDRYGRYISRLYLKDGTCLNRLMVLNGYAFFYPHAKEMTPFTRSLLQAQKEAIAEGRGFWPRILSMPEAEDSWLGNKNSRRFHAQDCKYGRKTSPKNRRLFPSLRRAFEAGYAPCRECSPWPGEK
ncbi:MAG: thermonuclease family protein [Desulfonatronovibrionaceae bacterium]